MLPEKARLGGRGTGGRGDVVSHITHYWCMRTQGIISPSMIDPLFNMSLLKYFQTNLSLPLSTILDSCRCSFADLFLFAGYGTWWVDTGLTASGDQDRV